MNNPKYVEIEVDHRVSKTEMVPMLEIYELVDVKDATCYLAGKGWGKLIRRDIVRC